MCIEHDILLLLHGILILPPLTAYFRSQTAKDSSPPSHSPFPPPRSTEVSKHSSRAIRACVTLIDYPRVWKTLTPTFQQPFDDLPPYIPPPPPSSSSLNPRMHANVVRLALYYSRTYPIPLVLHYCFQSEPAGQTCGQTENGRREKKGSSGPITIAWHG